MEEKRLYELVDELRKTLFFDEPTLEHLIVRRILKLFQVRDDWFETDNTEWDFRDTLNDEFNI